MTATCRKCPSPLPPRRGARSGRQREVCDGCRLATKRAVNARRTIRRRAGSMRPRAVSALGPAHPLLGPEELQRQEEARVRRFLEAVADGLDRDVLMERFPDARELLARHRLRAGYRKSGAFGAPA